MPEENPPQDPPQKDTPPPALREIVPEDLRDRGYLKDLLDKPQNPDTFKEVFKKLDGAETLIGRKIGIPSEDAKDEEVQKFYDSLRPKTAEDYELPVGEKADEEFVKTLRGSFHEAGLSKRQAKVVIEKMAPALTEADKKQSEEQEALGKKFDELASKTFGDDKEKALKRIESTVSELAPDNVKDLVQGLSPEAKVVLGAVVDEVVKKYVPEGESPKGQGDGAGGEGKSINERLRELYGSEAFRDFQHPKHKEALQKQDDLLEEIRKKGASR